MGASEIGSQFGTAELVDRFSVQLIGGRALAHERTTAGLDSPGEGSVAGSGDLDEPLDGVVGEFEVAEVHCGLDQLREGPHRRAQRDRVGGGGGGRGRGLVVAAETVVEHRRPPTATRRQSLSLRSREVRRVGQDSDEVRFVAPQGMESQPCVGRDVTAGRRGDALGFRRECSGPGEVSHPRRQQAQLPEMERELRDGARLPHELHVARGDGMEALDVPRHRGGERRHPSPPQDIVERQISERAHGAAATVRPLRRVRR